MGSNGALLNAVGSCQLCCTSALSMLSCAALCCAEPSAVPAVLCSLGNEFGAVHKPWDSAEIRFALTYPEIYEGAHLGRLTCC